MIELENEKIPICPVCLEILKIGVYFCSDGYLYDKSCFTKLEFKSPITGDKSFHNIFPQIKVNGITVSF